MDGRWAAKLWPRCHWPGRDHMHPLPPPLPTPFLGSLAQASWVRPRDASFCAVTYCRKVVGQEGVFPKRAESLLRPPRMDYNRMNSLEYPRVNRDQRLQRPQRFPIPPSPQSASAVDSYAARPAMVGAAQLCTQQPRLSGPTATLACSFPALLGLVLLLFCCSECQCHGLQYYPLASWKEMEAIFYPLLVGPS